MIWSVILYILAGLFGLFILFLLLILFSPFCLDLRWKWVGDDSGDCTVSLWWIHPFIITGKYNFPEDDFSLKITWWKIQRKKNQIQSSESEENYEITPAKLETEPATKAGLEEKKTGISEKKVEIQEPTTETVEKKFGKIDNLIEKIKRNEYLFFLRQKKWREKISRWFIGFLKSFRYMIRWNLFSATIKAGVEDPAVLGKIYGYYEAISNGIDIRNSRFNIMFEPVFMKNCFEGFGEIRIRSSIGNLLAPVGIAIFTFPYLNTFIVWYRLRRRSRKMKDNKKT